MEKRGIDLEEDYMRVMVWSRWMKRERDREIKKNKN